MNKKTDYYFITWSLLMFGSIIYASLSENYWFLLLWAGLSLGALLALYSAKQEDKDE